MVVNMKYVFLNVTPCALVGNDFVMYLLEKICLPCN